MFLLLSSYICQDTESSDWVHMPLFDPGKQLVFQSRFETILCSWSYGACVDGPNDFSDLHSGHLTVNPRKVPVSGALLTFGFAWL